MDLEIQLFPRKVYINTLSSSLVDHSAHIPPQWITESQVNFVSAYEFASYNIQQQTTKIIPRDQGETEVLCVQFKAEINEINCIMYYAYRQQSNFYLVHLPDHKSHPKILLYRNQNQQRHQIVEEFIGFLINQGEQIQSRASIISRTQKIIDQIQEQDEKEGQNKNNNYMRNIKQLVVIHQCNFALLLVQMKTKLGLMIVNLTKVHKTKANNLYCPIYEVLLSSITPQSFADENELTRVIYLFQDPLLSIHRTKDLTKFILHTAKHILLVKLNYETMEIAILHKIQSSHKEKYLSIDLCFSGDDQVVMVLCQLSKITTFNKLEVVSRKQLKMFLIEDKKLKEIKVQRNHPTSVRYEIQKRYIFKEDVDERQPGNVRFINNVIQSKYEVDQGNQLQSPGDLNRGILMKVFNEVLQNQKQQQKQVIHAKQKSLKSIENSLHKKSMTASQNNENCFIKQIGGFTCSQDLMLIWQKNESVVHVCKINSAKQQQQKYRNQIEQKKQKISSQLQQEEQLKQAYKKLMGKTYSELKEEKTFFQTILQYECRIELGLTNHKIKFISISPGNSNILIVSGNDKSENSQGNKELVSFDIFQIDLCRQLGNQEPSVFFKPFKNIYKPKPIDIITTSLVKQSTLFLTGNLVHSLQNQLIDGALSFDVHPYNIFLAVSFGFTAKVFALEGNQKLTTLYTINGQGMKQLKYSPLGNHLCIVFSKTIKIVDSYSFTTMFTINQKNSNFLKCYYSSNGHEFYSLNENHQIVAYNTFDYSKIDSIKPVNNFADFKPISIKAFLKHSQYCFVLQNGGIFVKYKSNAVVVVQQQLFKYNDGHLINCIEIDQKNGILFTGTKSGIVRAHLWPDKDGSFDNFTEIRTSFSSITQLALSNTSPIIYIGHQNGNITKAKYIIERQRRLQLENDRSAIMNERNPRYLNLQNLNNVQKMYKFVLQNGAIVTEDLPQKLRLQYKLSEVIQKLNGQMQKLKTNIQQELEQKAQLSAEKVDIGLLYHIKQMVSTKLYTQLREQTEMNNKQLEQLKKNQAQQVKQILITQNDLAKEKCFKVSDFSQLRNKMKEHFEHQYKKQKEFQEMQLKNFQEQANNAKKASQCGEQKIYYLPNQFIQEYSEQKEKLEREFQYENKKHFQLRKECAYKQTAIKGLYAKKIKQETLEFKVQLEKSQMETKLNYNNSIVGQLKNQIKEAQSKVHKVQIESSVIKANAQFKRVANIEQMNDACSYKLETKKKIENDIAALSDSLAQMEDLLSDKGNNVVEQISIKNNFNSLVQSKSQEMTDFKKKLKMAKLNLINTHHKLRIANPLEEYKSLRSSFVRKQKKVDDCSVESWKQKILKSQRGLKTSNSSRYVSSNSKNIEIYNKLMEKQTKFLKSNIKIHHKKIKKIEKQNGELLFQYQKLKWETLDLKEKQIIKQNSLEKAKKGIHFEQFQGIKHFQPNAQVQLSKTPFQKYIQLKSRKTAQNLTTKTATSTPIQIGNISPSTLNTDRIK